MTLKRWKKRKLRTSDDSQEKEWCSAIQEDKAMMSRRRPEQKKSNAPFWSRETPTIDWLVRSFLSGIYLQIPLLLLLLLYKIIEMTLSLIEYQYA